MIFQMTISTRCTHSTTQFCNVEKKFCNGSVEWNNLPEHLKQCIAKLISGKHVGYFAKNHINIYTYCYITIVLIFGTWIKFKICFSIVFNEFNWCQHSPATGLFRTKVETITLNTMLLVHAQVRSIPRLTAFAFGKIGISMMRMSYLELDVLSAREKVCLQKPDSPGFYSQHQPRWAGVRIAHCSELEWLLQHWFHLVTSALGDLQTK